MDGVAGVAQVFLSMLASGLAVFSLLYIGGIFNVFKTLGVFNGLESAASV